MTEWPYTIEDKAKAIHYAIEPDCGYANLNNCMALSHRLIVRVLEEAAKWEETNE